MDLIDEIRNIAAKIEKGKELVKTEEATKNAFVMPFIGALGYDVFDPTEVTPEMICDVGVKKGEKIDYAVKKDGNVIMLFECKHYTANLDLEHASQLYRYFSVTDAKIGVLTNGIEYRFFSDLDAPNKMDSKPFLIINVLDFPEVLVPELKKFSKAAFSISDLLSTANELKYTREIKSLLAKELVEPSEEFVRFCANGIGGFRMTQAVRDQFKQLTKKALSEFVSDRMNERLKKALNSGTTATPAKFGPEAAPVVTNGGTEKETIHSSVEEMEGFYAVKGILRDVIDPKRIFARDQQSYFGILLDDSNRKPICRLHFNAKRQKYIGLFDGNKNEERVPIDGVDDIYKLAKRLQKTANAYQSDKLAKGGEADD
jgi:predicted type IV restriction endonuclease